jgi:hypothetical protein
MAVYLKPRDRRHSEHWHEPWSIRNALTSIGPAAAALVPVGRLEATSPAKRVGTAQPALGVDCIDALAAQWHNVRARSGLAARG